MAIVVEKNGRLFNLHTADSTYQMYADEYGVLLHTYYGKRIDGENLADLIFQVDVGFSGNPEETVGNREYSLDCLPQELPSDGVGDYRESCISLLHENGSMAADFRFESYEVFPGSYKVAGMPALYDSDGEKGETLVITMREKASSVVVRLCYGVFEKENVITRAVRVENRGESRVVLDKCLSCCLDLQFGEYDLITFAGRHTMERGPERNRVRRTKLEVGSMRGTSSHQYNPTAILCVPDATEDYGDCYGLCLVYSGNFTACAQMDQRGQTRVLMGINPEKFSFRLEKDDCFDAPQVILSYSDAGLSSYPGSITGSCGSTCAAGSISTQSGRCFSITGRRRIFTLIRRSWSRSQGRRRNSALRCWCSTTAGLESGMMTTAVWGTGMPTSGSWAAA